MRLYIIQIHTLLDNQKLYTLAEIEPLIRVNAIIDGRSGGFVIGDLSLDTIQLMREHQQEGFYEIVTTVHPGSYILNPFATAQKRYNLLQLNAEFPELEKVLFNDEIPDNIKTLDARPARKEHQGQHKIIFIDQLSQQIINPYATQKQLQALDTLNRNYSK
ncbi:hypothetical protein SAMN05216480_10425 [Pustulibacterium marinum]|uniref:Uncharacterized protein n=1 Tax=Pustulibacterium marinum TaxID=1224947 RepID=A0A1I7GAI0_9FLAO|nr:hypothetical protein [Pustulibacterium marinum]SFU45371.1 hypothetical protein SAMN05216480_10425 [Pustulibacterium marinum]